MKDWGSQHFAVNGSDAELGAVCKAESARVIANLSTDKAARVHVFGDNSNAFYWSDGDVNALRVLTVANASTGGLYVSGDIDAASFGLKLGNLRSGKVYRVRVFVGVWGASAHFKLSLSVGDAEYVFHRDRRLYSDSRLVCRIGARAD